MHLGDDDNFDGAMGGDSGHVAAPAMVRALEIDGTCVTALKGEPSNLPHLRMFFATTLPLPPGLITSCAHCPACMLRAAQGCLKFLDMDPSILQKGMEGRSRMQRIEAAAAAAWGCLAACLCGLAENLLSEGTIGAWMWGQIVNDILTF